MPDDSQQDSKDPRQQWEDLLKSTPFQFVPQQQPGPQTNRPPEDKEEPFQLDFDYLPRDLKLHLDRFVIGQTDAKKALAIALCDHYRHVQRVHAGRAPSQYLKPNVLLLGPTGVGKTYLIRCLAEKIGVPFVKADATKFSETGYVGQDVDELVRSLVQQAGGQIPLAECGIVYIDEIDKIAAAGNLTGRDVSGRGVQTNLLKLLEETDVPLRAPNDIQGQMEMAMEMARGQKSRPKFINTRNILFIASGAFPNLPDIISRRLRSGSIGFQAADTPSDLDEQEILARVNAQDLMAAGFEAEFIGRLPVRVSCHELTVEHLEEIMLNAEDSILLQYQSTFSAYDINLEVKSDAVRRIAELAHKEKTGARGLLSVLENLLRDLKFEVPSTPLKAITIDETFINNPESGTRQILEEARKLEIESKANIIERFTTQFEREHELKLHFTDDALDALVETAHRNGQPLTTTCAELFKEFPYGLKLVASNTGQKAFTLDRPAVENPKKYLSDLVVASYKTESS